MIFQIFLLLFANVSLEGKIHLIHDFVFNTRPSLAVTRLQSVVEGINEGLSR